MNHLFNFSILSFVLVVFSGCDVEKETIPSYIHIKKFTLTTDKFNQGLNTQDITDTKVFANGNEVGTFELPVTIPVFAEGDVEITLFPNIKETGSANYRKYYKPYVTYIETFHLEKLKIDTIYPVTSYRPGAGVVKFDWLEDFDDNALSLEKYGLNNTNDSIMIIPSNSPGVDAPFTNTINTGKIEINNIADFENFEVATLPRTGFIVPNLGIDVYVEMDFKSNVNFQVGIFTYAGAVVSRVPVFYAYPTNGVWKKIYINLKSETSDLPAGTPIRVFFGVYKDPDNPNLKPLVYLDNLKLLYLP